MAQYVMLTKQDFPYPAGSWAEDMLKMRAAAAGGLGSGSGCGGRYQTSPCFPGPA